MEEKLTKRLYELFILHPEVTTDSRKCPVGSMFFALKGETFDGNLFAAKALELGSAVAVVDNPAVIPEGDERYVLVPDVLSALQALAAYHRQQFKGPVLQVTGTNGKTTTKELLAAVLSRRYRVLYTQGNLNNHIGVPLTLLRLRPEHELAIIETGANHPGEIAFLTDIVRPDFGLITNVGRAHLEGFGSFEGVKATKGELYDYLSKKNSAQIFVNGSSHDLCGMLTERGIDPLSEKCIAYGHQREEQARWICQGEVESCNPMLRIRWTDHECRTYEAGTQLIGDYNLDNVLAAVAAGLHFGVDAEDIVEALESYRPSLGRSEYRKTAHNELIIDAYNANLTSMQAALKNFKKIGHPHKMVILGDMRELGAESAAAHRGVVEEVLNGGGTAVHATREAGDDGGGTAVHATREAEGNGGGTAVHATREAGSVERAWFVGENFEAALKESGKPNGISVECFKDVDAVKQEIEREQPEGWLILIKGSNSTKLHQLPERL